MVLLLMIEDKIIPVFNQVPRYEYISCA